MVLHLTLRWHAGASSKELALRWVGIGFIVGLGCWVNPLIISGVLAAVIWVAGYCIVEIVKQYKKMDPPRPVSATLRPASRLLLAAAAIPACIIGLTPALIWGATHQWQNVTYIQNLGGDLSRHRLSCGGFHIRTGLWRAGCHTSESHCIASWEGFRYFYLLSLIYFLLIYMRMMFIGRGGK